MRTHSESMTNMSRLILKPKFFILLIIVFTLIIWIYTYYSLTIYFVDISSEHPSFIVHDNSGYLIKTSGCRIPEMFLRGPDIDKYMKYEKIINCKSTWNYTLPLVTSNLTALILNTTARATLNITKNDPTFKCYYVPIERSVLKDKQNVKEYNDNNVKFGKKVYFKKSITVPDEMVEVVCTLKKQTVYREYHIFVRPNPEVVNRNDGDLSVFILGLDAVSRLNFHRQMPKSSQFLSSLGNVEMLGYNKVEDNTFPNLIPLLSGHPVEELREECWPKDDDFFDGCHFVWDDFKNANYGTVFVEDSPMIGMFNYMKSGFLRKPTDHYLRPVMLQSEYNLGHEHNGNCVNCIGGRLGMTVLLDYAFKIALSMADRLYMGFFWSTSLSHDYIEFPRYGDDDLLAFLDAFNGSGQLNHTVLILMSDHGLRWGEFRDTYQGGLEDRLPMLRFVVPEWFKAAYPRAVDNLNRNALRLTTPYDLHETLLDLVDARRLDDETIGAREEAAVPGARGASLFLEIPETKTCRTAGVPKHYCACHEARTALAVDDTEAVTAARALTDYVNAKLWHYPSCSNLSLYRIHSATVEVGSGSTAVKDFEIQVSTVPGFGKFEATIRQYGDAFNVVGSISRLNVYGNQSVCVNDTTIKLLCYCQL